LAATDNFQEIETERCPSHVAEQLWPWPARHRVGRAISGWIGLARYGRPVDRSLDTLLALPRIADIFNWYERPDRVRSIRNISPAWIPAI